MKTSEVKKIEECFRTALDNLMEGCQIIGLDWRYLYVNNTADIHNRRPKEELLGKRYMDMWPGIETTEVFSIIKHCMEERVPNHLENEFIFPDGTVRWFDLSIQPVPEGVFILTIDITERKRAEEALRPLSSRNEAILASVPDIIMEVDNNKIYTWANRAGIEFFGGDVIGKEAVYYFEGEQETYNIVQPLFYGSEKIIYVESWQRRSDGKKRLLAWYCIVLKDENGIVTGALSSARDITELKRAENALRESEKKLREAQEMAHLGFWHWDVKTGDVEWSEEVFKIFCLDPKEFTPRIDSILSLSPWPEDHQRDQELINRAIENHRSGSYEQKFLRPDQSIGYYYSTFQGNYDEKGDLISIVGTVLDITERKHAEKEIQKLNAELEQRIIERTAQLEAANKELEAFSYSVSHDLRAPLRGINGFAQILLEDYAGILDDEGKRICSVICDNSLKMGHLIDDLLTFSRLSRTEMQLSVISMKTLVNSIYYEVTDAQSRARIDLSIGDIFDALGEPTMLRQVWANLLSNAIKYSSKRDKAIISVTCKKEKEKCIYCIKDNGVGFDMNYVDKLFGVFQRLHSAKDFEGTGVGLAIVQRIIRRHGGEVWAEGEVDKGATFYFSLPMIDSESMSFS